MADIPDDVMNEAWRMLSVQPSRNSFSRADVAAFIARAIMGERTRDKWQPIETAPHQRSIWVAYQNYGGKWRTVKAQFIPEFSREIDYDNDQLEGVYSDEKDAYFWPEGWYEQIENWDDFSSIAMSYVPNYWQPLPPPPAIKGASHDQA